MTYHDYAWECKALPMRYRVAEMYARAFIGFAWGFAVVASLSLLTPPESAVWYTYTACAFLWLGFVFALPPEEVTES